MPYPYFLHPIAHEEYINAYEWYEMKQDGLGDRFMTSVERTLRQVIEHPEYFSKQKDNFRSAKVKGFPYAIVYQFLKRKQVVYVASIYHGKRRPGRKYRRIKR